MTDGEMTRERAYAELVAAAPAAGVEISWIEITHQTGERRDIRMKSTQPLCLWHLNLEVFGDNGFGGKRFRHIREVAPHLHQAVNRAVIGMQNPKRISGV